MFLGFLDVYKKMWKMKNFPSLVYLSFEWNVGFVLIVFVGIQIISGILLSLFVEVGIQSCLESKNFLLKEVELGWWLSSLHMILPNFIFIFLYVHMFKGVLYSIFSYGLVWGSGFFIWMLFIIISFTGYGLMFGSLGLWAIVVAMGMVDFLFGEVMVFLLFSDFGSLSDLLALKVFSYHFLTSLCVGIFMFMHIYLVHLGGSSLGVFSGFMDYYSFSSFLFTKDFLVLLGSLVGLGGNLFFKVEDCFSIDNFVELDIFMVPEEINSEWYLSFIFIILKGVDNKSFGLGFVFLSLLWVFLSVMNSSHFGDGLFGEGGGVILIFFISTLFFLMLVTLNSFLGSLWVSSIILSLLMLVGVEWMVVDFFFFFVKGCIEFSEM